MLKEKSKQFKVSTNKSKLKHDLWLIDDYLQQKKNRGVKKNFLLIIYGLRLLNNF